MGNRHRSHHAGRWWCGSCLRLTAGRASGGGMGLLRILALRLDVPGAMGMAAVRGAHAGGGAHWAWASSSMVNYAGDSRSGWGGDGGGQRRGGDIGGSTHEGREGRSRPRPQRRAWCRPTVHRKGQRRRRRVEGMAARDEGAAWMGGVWAGDVRHWTAACMSEGWARDARCWQRWTAEWRHGWAGCRAERDGGQQRRGRQVEVGGRCGHGRCRVMWHRQARGQRHTRAHKHKCVVDVVAAGRIGAGGNRRERAGGCRRGLSLSRTGVWAECTGWIGEVGQGDSEQWVGGRA